MDLLRIAARVCAATGPLSERPDYGSGHEGEDEDDGSRSGVVRKTPGKGYCVKSEKNPSWSGGCFPSKAKAKKRLNQVEYFKHASDGVR